MSSRLFFYGILALIVVSMVYLTPRVAGFSKHHYGYLSAHGLSLSQSVFMKPYGLMHEGRKLNKDGEVVASKLYNRFSVFPFALMGLSMGSTSDPVFSQTIKARRLVSLMFALSIVFMTLALMEAGYSRWVSLFAAVVPATTHYFMFYWGLTFNDPFSLLGCCLVCWACAKSINGSLSLTAAALISGFSILLGWQVAVFIVVWSLCALLYRGWRFAFITLTVGGTVGLAILVGQIYAESHYLGWEFFDSPSLRSGIHRAGLTDDSPTSDEYVRFYVHTLHRIDQLVMPFKQFWLGTWNSLIYKSDFYNFVLPALGVGIISISMIKASSRQLVFLVALCVAPLLWHFPLKDFTYAHDFQMLFFYSFGVAMWVGIASRIDRGSAAMQLGLGIALTAVLITNLYLVRNYMEASYRPLSNLTSQIDKKREAIPEGVYIQWQGEIPHDTTYKAKELYMQNWVKSQETQYSLGY